MADDRNNVFARILRGERPCDKVLEDEHVLAFRDINPQAPTHIVVIPKGEYVSFDDFAEQASAAEQAALIRAIGVIRSQEGAAESGYRYPGKSRGGGAPGGATFPPPPLRRPRSRADAAPAAVIRPAGWMRVEVFPSGAAEASPLCLSPKRAAAIPLRRETLHSDR